MARLPWGNVEYGTLDVLVPQLEELFVRRLYSLRSYRAAPVIVDCGGNIGLSAIWFKQAYPDAKLTVYEADPSLAAVLDRNAKRAGFDDILVKNRAVWTASGEVQFAVTGSDTGKIVADGTTRVLAIDLATELPETVDLLKMDIEGAEFPVLRHLCHTRAIERVRNLVCELHVTRERTDDLIDILRMLRVEGMELSMTAGVGPWIGLAERSAPFETIDRSNVFMILYAWRPA